MTTQTRRAITVACIAASALIIVAVIAGTITGHGSPAGAVGACGWPAASIVAGIAYLKSTRRDK